MRFAASCWHMDCDKPGVFVRAITSLLLLATILVARSESSPAPEIPFVFTNGLLWVQVTVPGSKEPLHFLLDSGAAVSVVNLSTAKRLGLKLGSPVRVSGVGSTSRGYWPQRLEASAAKIALPIQYLAVDLARLSAACNCCVDGLLGADFFRDRAVQIDFAEQKIRLLPSKSVPDSGLVVKLKSSRNALLAPVSVNGSATKWVRVDTGCASALQWVDAAAPEKRWNSSVSIGLAELSIPVAPARIRLGGKEFNSIATGWHSRPIFAGENGLLGNGLLNRFGRVTIDVKAGKMILDEVKPAS